MFFCGGLDPDGNNFPINIANVRLISLILAHDHIIDLTDVVVHIVIPLHCDVDQDHIEQRDSCTDSFFVVNISGTNCIQSVINTILQGNEVPTQRFLVHAVNTARQDPCINVSQSAGSGCHFSWC